MVLLPRRRFVTPLLLTVFFASPPLPDRSAGEIWRLRFAKAPEGVLEDHYLELRGVPAILALTPDSVLRP